MNQHQILKAIQIFAFFQNRQIRPNGGAGCQHPQSFAVGDLFEHKEARRFADDQYFITGLQRRQAWAQLAVRYGDQIELEIGIMWGVNVGVGALHALAVDIKTELGKLPGGEWFNRCVDGEAKQCIRPVMHLNNFACYPVSHGLSPLNIVSLSSPRREQISSPKGPESSIDQMIQRM